MDYSKKTPKLQIVDFGESCKFDKNTIFNKKVGAPYYMAPEVIEK